MPARRSVARTGLLLAAVLALCRIASLGKELLVAGTFGAGDQIDAYVITAAGGLGNQKLGTDAVGGGDEQRVRIPGGLEIEQAAEAAKLGIRAGPLGCRRQRLDGFDEGVAGIDIDTGILVTRAPG